MVTAVPRNVSKRVIIWDHRLRQLIGPSANEIVLCVNIDSLLQEVRNVLPNPIAKCIVFVSRIKKTDLDVARKLADALFVYLCIYNFKVTLLIFI